MIEAVAAVAAESFTGTWMEVWGIQLSHHSSVINPSLTAVTTACVRLGCPNFAKIFLV